MQIEKRSMGWLPKQSTYDYVQTLGAKRREHAQAALASNESLASSLSGAVVSNGSGLTNLSLQIATQRVQAEMRARLSILA